MCEHNLRLRFNHGEPAARIPDAGADQEQCGNALFVLDAVTPNIGTGTWILPAGVTIVSGGVNNPKATVSVPAGMSAALGWTVTIGKCVVGPDTVIITNLAPVTGNTIEEDQLICSGSQPAEITSVGAPAGGNGTYTYSWQRSTTSATTGFMTIGGATGPNYQPPALTQTTWYRRVVTSGSCTSTSNPVQIMISTAPPNIVSTPPDTSVQCYTGRDYTIYFGTPQFDHPEGLPVTVTHADVVTPAACGQTITRTWTATDSCNKTTTTSQTITVIDTIKTEACGCYACGYYGVLRCHTGAGDLPGVRQLLRCGRCGFCVHGDPHQRRLRERLSACSPVGAQG